MKTRPLQGLGQVRNAARSRQDRESRAATGAEPPNVAVIDPRRVVHTPSALGSPDPQPRASLSAPYLPTTTFMLDPSRSSLNGVPDASDAASGHTASKKSRTRTQQYLATIGVHLKRHAGAGIMASVAYFDPGNWSVDLQAGSEFGYRLLFVVLLASLGAVVLQALACKLGCVTGADLAMHCRLLLGNRPKHPKLVRATLLWPLYILCEIAIIATDLAELLGSAIGLCLLIGPKFPLWAGVVVTACDVLLVLTISKARNGRPARVVEFVVVLLVLATFICFVVLIVKVSPDWPSVFQGYLPSKALVQHGAIYTSIGILGATVMPHALFLGSSLATLDRMTDGGPVHPSGSEQYSTKSQCIKQAVKSLLGSESTDEETAPAKRHSEWENRSPGFVLAHLKHGVVDMVASLLGFAMVINSAILVLAAAVFFRTRSTEDGESPAGLFDAHDLITRSLGKPAGYMFAIALLCAGQSASLTATMAGQVVSEGFIQWRVSPFMRRLITRLLGLLPSAVVASVFGRRGIDSLLVGSQVALSFVLPFAVFPLVWLTSSPKIMKVKQEDGTYVDYSNSWWLRALGYLIFVIVVLANGYAIVSLAMGQGTA